MIVDAMNQIELFQNLVYISWAILAVGLGLSIFFYFYFKIPHIFLLMTGKAKQDTIQKLSEESAKSGKLRNAHMINHGHSVELSDDLGRTGPTGRVARTGMTGSIQNGARVSPPPQIMAETEPIGQDELMETSILGKDQDEMQTTVLTKSDDQSTDQDTGATILLSKKAPQIRFDVVEKTISIHTDELLS